MTHVTNLKIQESDWIQIGPASDGDAVLLRIVPILKRHLSLRLTSDEAAKIGLALLQAAGAIGMPSPAPSEQGEVAHAKDHL
jgi:hypothetical protein